MQKLLLSLALACSGCTHLTSQLVQHAPELAAWGAAAYAGQQVLGLVNTADDTAQRVERRLGEE